MNLKSEVIKRSIGIYPKVFSFLRFAILPINKIDSIVPKNGNIVDYGCGYGATSCYFALSSKDRHVIGVERDKIRVKKAMNMARSIHNLKFKLGDISKIEIANADAHLLIDVLHHMPFEEQTKLLENIIKRIKKGNLIVIKEIDKRPFFKYAWNFVHDKIMTLNDELYFRDQKWLENFLDKKKLRVKAIRCENLLYPHFIIAARK